MPTASASNGGNAEGISMLSSSCSSSSSSGGDGEESTSERAGFCGSAEKGTGELGLEPGHGTNGTLLTAGIIVADVVGAAILPMPVAIAQFGWLLGAALVVALLAMNVHISVVMWRVKMRFPEARGYAGMVTAAFSKAPAWQKALADKVTWISQQAFLLSMVGVMLLFASKGLGTMNFDRHICLPVWMLVALALILPFAVTARTMGAWQSLIWVNILSLVGSVTIPIIYVITADVTDVRPPGSVVYAVAPLTLSGVVRGLCLLTYGFSGQVLLAEVIDEMEEPAKLPEAYAYFSAPFQAVAFLLTGVVGYCYVGDKVEGLISDDLPFGIALRLCGGCLLAHMLITYLIKNVVFCRSVHFYIDAAHACQDSWRAWSVWTAIVLTVGAVSYLGANAVPFFVDAMGMLGATLNPLVSLIIPLVSYLRAYADGGKEEWKLGRTEATIIGLEIFWTLVMACYGMIDAAKTLAQNWDTYGYPFECHCQGIWNTCECSASHIGMWDCGTSAPLVQA